MNIGDLLTDLQGVHRQDGTSEGTPAPGATPILKESSLAIRLNAVERQVSPRGVIGFEFVVNLLPVFVWVAEG